MIAIILYQLQSRQHNIVPELHLVSRVTHVALAFIRSEVFNIPDQQEWPLFTTVAEVRPKFANDTKVQVAIGGWGNTEGFSIAARTAANRKLFAANVKAMINATGADGEPNTTLVKIKPKTNVNLWC